MGEMQKIDRRQFLIGVSAVGGGMALGIMPTRDSDAASADPVPWIENRAAGTVEFTPWIAIAPDDTVTIQIATPEIGNGTMTQCAANVVEELQCDWSKVRTEFAPVARDYRENAVYSTIQGPTAYFSGRSTHTERMNLLLQVGASARERLKAAAAAEWRAPVSEITAADSVLTHAKSGRKLRYGEIAAKAAEVKLDAEPTLKPQSEWTFLGKA